MEFLRQIDMRPKNLRLFLFGIFLLLAFFVVLVMQTQSSFSLLDPQMTSSLQTVVPRILDVPLSLLSLFGRFEFCFLFLVILSFFYYKKFKKIPYPFILFFAILVFEFIGKLFVYHPGPPPIFLRYDLPFDIPTVDVTTKYSFPSGHVSRTIFLLILAIFLAVKHVRKNTTKTLAVAAVLFIGVAMVVSRIYLGEHWTSDVLGGALLGGSLGFLALVYY